MTQFNIQNNSCETGRILIKIVDSLKEQFNNCRLCEGSDFLTGYTEFDDLCAKYGAKTRIRLVDRLYEHSEKSRECAIKHDNLGLNRWEEITVDVGTDIASFIQELVKLDKIECAEPVILPKAISPILGPKLSVEPSTGDSTPSTDSVATDIPNYNLDNQWALHNVGQYDLPDSAIEPGYSEPNQTGTPGWDIRAVDAWQIETGSPNVIVAVLDGYTDVTHPDIVSNIWSGSNNLDGSENDTSGGYEEIGHGMHVSGIVAATRNNTIGVAGIAGGGSHGQGVKIMPINIFGTHGKTFLELFMFAADNGASICQCSWSSAHTQSLEDGLEYFNLHGGGDSMEGGVCFFAAGNNNNENQNYPAGDDRVFTVAAHDNRGAKASFSNYGTWVDITAPGMFILSTMLNNKYQWLSGTSQACPHVSGVAALVLSHAPLRITSQQLKDIILNSARTELLSLNPTYAGKLGAGALDAHAALVEAQATKYTARAKMITTTPANNATNVNITSPITIEFSKQMKESETVSALNISPSTSGTWSMSGNTFSYTLSSDLQAGTQYTVTAATNAKDSAGNDIEPSQVFSFTTASSTNVPPESPSTNGYNTPTIAPYPTSLNRVAPVASVVLPSATVVNERNLSLQWTADKPDCKFKWMLQGEVDTIIPWTTVWASDTTLVHQNISNGTYTFYVKAIDLWGNTSVTVSKVVEVRRGLLSPSLIAPSADDILPSGNVTFRVDVPRNEPGDVYHYAFQILEETNASPLQTIYVEGRQWFDSRDSYEGFSFNFPVPEDQGGEVTFTKALDIRKVYWWTCRISVIRAGEIVFSEPAEKQRFTVGILATKISLLATPSVVRADGESEVTIQAKALDARGQLDVQWIGTANFSLNSGESASFTLPHTGVVFAAGIASTKLVSETIGTVHLASIANKLLSDNIEVNFVANRLPESPVWMPMTTTLNLSETPVKKARIGVAVPADADNDLLHFKIEIDTEATFDSPNLIKAETRFSTVGWTYFDGNNEISFPVDGVRQGVPSTYVVYDTGEVLSDLTHYYCRVAAWDNWRNEA